MFISVVETYFVLQGPGLIFSTVKNQTVPTQNNHNTNSDSRNLGKGREYEMVLHHRKSTAAH